MTQPSPEEDRYMRSIVENDQAWKDFTKHPTRDTWGYYTDAAAEEGSAAIAWLAWNPNAITTIKDLSPHLFANGGALSVRMPIDNREQKV